MKLWFISDTHNQHELLSIPNDVDAVVHCGDESDSGNAWLNERSEEHTSELQSR